MSDNIDMKTLLGLVSKLTQQMGNLTRHYQQQKELLLRVQQPAVPPELTVRVVVVPDEPAQVPVPAPAEPARSDAAPILPEAAWLFQPIAYDRHKRLEKGEAAEYLQNPDPLQRLQRGWNSWKLESPWIPVEASQWGKRCIENGNNDDTLQ